MSDTNLPQVPHSGFPQVYDGQLFDSLSVMVEQAFAKFLPLVSNSSKEQSSHV